MQVIELKKYNNRDTTWFYCLLNAANIELHSLVHIGAYTKHTLCRRRYLFNRLIL